ncbi:MAG: hypothetical protein PHC69_03560 [Ruminiclostridium sp.]|nr:hypothetical protein [Ruminiclostridium sp.]
MKVFKSIFHIIIIFLVCITLLSISLYGIFSSTLFNPAFYTNIMNNSRVQNSIEVASEYITQSGFIIDSQSLKDNLLSLAGGIIRYITQEDMSFSSITIDNGNVESFRASILSEAHEQFNNIPDISQIHPYMLSYFISGSENIYSLLHFARNNYSLYKTFYPVIILFSLFIVLLSKKPAKYSYIAFTTTSILLAIFGLILRILRDPFVIAPIERVSQDLVVLLEPFISKVINRLLLYFLLSAMVLFVIAIILRFKPVNNMLSKIPKKAVVLLIIITAVFSIIYRHDLYSIIIRNFGNNSQYQQMSTLIQDDGAVHSLIIKLKEQGSDKPIDDVTIVVNKIDFPYNPLYESALSNSLGNARFILPSGSFLVYADESRLPYDYNPFEPIILNLNNPDNSCFTIYLTKKEKPKVPNEVQSGKIYSYPY